MISEQLAAQRREDFMSHVRPEVAARRQLGTPITWQEAQGFQYNSYEWQHLTPLFDDDALVRSIVHALANGEHGGCPSTEYSRPCVTYPEVLERLLVPLLLERFAAARGLAVPAPAVDVDPGDLSEDA